MSVGSKDDGGAAFPGIVERPAGGLPGMSLRDYFAATVLPSVIAKRHPSLLISEASTWHVCAAISYEIADAMLQERAQ